MGLQLEFRLLNAVSQTEAKCALGESFCGTGGAWEGQACPQVGAVCAGQCSGGTNFCSFLVKGDCSKFLLPEQASEANRACVGGVCLASNSGRQCPRGALLSSKGQVGPPPLANRTYDYTQSPVQYKGTFSQLNGAKVEVGGVDCDGVGACVATSLCVAANTDQECTDHLMCKDVFYPEKRVLGDEFAHRGPAICRRLRIPANLLLTVSHDSITPLQRSVNGEIFGLINPEPPKFDVRTISESSGVASTTNTFTLSLKSNFMLDPHDFSVTLTRISSPTLSNDKLPLVGSAQKKKSIEVDCVSSVVEDGQHIVRCENVGAGTLAEGDLVIEARLGLDAQCTWPTVPQGEYCSDTSTPSLSCLLVSRVRVGGTHVEGFSASPCVERLACLQPSICRVLNFMQVTHLLDPSVPANAAGFLVELQVSHAVNVQARVELWYSHEYLAWNQTKGEIIVRQDTAPSSKVDGRSLTVSFQLLNPATPGPAQVVTVVGRSGMVVNIGICDDVI